MARDDGSAILILGNILGNQIIPNLPDDQSLHGVSECKPIRAFNEVHRCPALELLAMRSQDFTRSRCIRSASLLEFQFARSVAENVS